MCIHLYCTLLCKKKEKSNFNFGWWKGFITCYKTFVYIFAASITQFCFLTKKVDRSGQDFF